MKFILLLGRILFSLIFLNTFRLHFSEAGVAYAGTYNVPVPHILVPLSAVIAMAGAISIILGFRAKAGAWLIVIFLIPVTFMMHAYWKETEEMQIRMQAVSFWKNMSMLGGAFIIAYFGSGPLSLDHRSPADNALNQV